jgi:hypothetical protein
MSVYTARFAHGISNAFKNALRELRMRPAAAAEKPVASLADLFPGRSAA